MRQGGARERVWPASIDPQSFPPGGEEEKGKETVKSGGKWGESGA